jgi:VPDSG-CTERM motif
MRKFYFAIALFAVLNLAQAASITANAPSGLIGKNALNASYAYLWTAPVAAQDITSATLTFTGVVRTGSGHGNDISVDIGNFLGMAVGQSSVPTLGAVGKIKDKDAAGDAFNANVAANDAIHLGTQFFSSKKTPQTWSYTFTGAQLEALNNYIAAGNWGFEIDPDGKFTVGGIIFSYTTAIADTKPVGAVASVPDSVATLGLLGGSFLVLLGVRRRFCLNQPSRI